MELAAIALERRPPWAPATEPLRIPAARPAAEPIPAARADLRFVLEERWREPRPPLSTRLPFHYHRLPGPLRRALAAALVRRAPKRPFPRLPFEPSVDALRWARGERVRWPHGKRAALLLTHDVDTRRGAALIPEFAALERALGLRSTFFVCSHHYPLDYDALARLAAEGFEIASHGYNHDNRDAFLPEAEREARLRAIAGSLGGRVPLAGFRSASLGRTPALYASLARHFAWDSSIPDVDLEGEGGCATVLPFRIGSLVEIPITLPIESSLLYRGTRPAEIFERWSEKLDWIRRVGGVANAVLHTEPHLGGHRELRSLYADWLASLAGDAWVTTPSELLAHLAREGFFAAASSAAGAQGEPPC
jgi:peptidoglycan/xylan/chitin deacetylase (PgdA/CDA1 family)